MPVRDSANLLPTGSPVLSVDGQTPERRRSIWHQLGVQDIPIPRGALDDPQKRQCRTADDHEIASGRLFHQETVEGFDGFTGRHGIRTSDTIPRGTVFFRIPPSRWRDVGDDFEALIDDGSPPCFLATRSRRAPAAVIPLNWARRGTWRAPSSDVPAQIPGIHS